MMKTVLLCPKDIKAVITWNIALINQYNSINQSIQYNAQAYTHLPLYKYYYLCEGENYLFPLFCLLLMLMMHDG